MLPNNNRPTTRPKDVDRQTQRRCLFKVNRPCWLLSFWILCGIIIGLEVLSCKVYYVRSSPTYQSVHVLLTSHNGTRENRRASKPNWHPVHGFLWVTLWSTCLYTISLTNSCDECTPDKGTCLRCNRFVYSISCIWSVNACLNCWWCKTYWDRLYGCCLQIRI